MTALERLNVLAKQAMHELDVIGVKYTKPTCWKLSRATSYFGTTIRKKNIITGKWEFVIKVSLMKLDEAVKDERVMDTIIHELIHTVDGCFNHGPNFKRLASLVNDCYACYNISRCAIADEAGISREVVKKYEKPKHRYTVCCPNCNRKFVYAKQTKLVKILSGHAGICETTYRCPCGSNKFYLR